MNAENQAGVSRHTFLSGGVTREYITYFPENLPKDAPLVLVIHGYTDNAQNMMETTRMNEVADKNKFAVCYPQAAKDYAGDTCWEVGYDFTADRGIDDQKYLVELTRYLQDTFHLSRKNTFVTGMSNGGEMSMYLAIRSKGVFRAFAPVCGSLYQRVFETIPDGEPFVPMFMINSAADDISYFDGDMENTQGYGPYLPTMQTLSVFLSRDAELCETVEMIPKKDPDAPTQIEAHRYENPKNKDHRVWFYKVINGKHDWPGHSGNMDINASEEVWNFFTLYLQ